MQLTEFIAAQKQMLDDFEASYLGHNRRRARTRTNKSNTLFRNPVEWKELLQEYMDNHDNDKEESSADLNNDRAA